MAIQVVTQDNFQQLVETGKVPEFKPPEAAKPAAETKTAGGETKTDEASSTPSTQARGADGKFTKPPGGDKTSTAASPKSATDDEDGDADLSEVVRQKIGKQHRLRKEAEEFAKGAYRKQLEAEQRAEQLQQQLKESQTKSRPDPEKTADEAEPKPEDFTTVGEYIDAAVKFGVKRGLAEQKAADARQREEERKAAQLQEYGKRLNAAREKHDDFDIVIQSLKGTEIETVHNDVVEYIQESDQGAELLYTLAKDRELLDRLRKLSPRRFIAELGKLEGKLEATPSPSADDTRQKLSDVAAAPTTTPAVSRAPAPITALSTDKSAVVHKDPKDMSFQELRAYERQREAERRAARH